jgi:DNA-binding MarR family transcriptional regulator
MPAIEIDEAEYNRLKGVADLAAAIHANPKGRVLLEQAHRTVNPKAPTPSIEQEERMSAPLNDVQKQIADLTSLVTKKFSDDETREKLGALSRQQDEGFARLREQRYTDEGIAKIRELMTEKGILDPEIAAAYFDRINPPAPVTPTGSNSFNLVESFNDESDKALQELMSSQGNSETALNKLVQESLNDFRKSVPSGRR